ncbi:MAG: putative ABC transporter permease [Clostridia bacterium]|nr:putative ABC transporter permease [Clostridia bacterium]
MKNTESIQGKITYDKLFWLFMAGSVTGVLIEGLFCLILRGEWESHVVTVVGPFNALYGAGAMLFFSVAALLKNKNIILKAAVIAVIATVLELLCGILLADGLGMRAWDYRDAFFNYRGMICLSFSLGWGVAGLVFCLLFNKIDCILCKLHGKVMHIICIVLSVLMAINLCITAVCIVHWSERHYHTAPDTKLGRTVDEMTPDDWMQHRFIEWSFIDETN